MYKWAGTSFCWCYFRNFRNVQNLNSYEKLTTYRQHDGEYMAMEREAFYLCLPSLQEVWTAAIGVILSRVESGSRFNIDIYNFLF